MADFRTPIRALMRLAVVAFAVVILWLSWWQVIVADRLRGNAYNRRQAAQLQRIEPGRIYTADGVLILGKERAEGRQWRPTYPEGPLFAHLTGYNAQTGLQRGLRDALYGLGAYANPWAALFPITPQGNDVVLTINAGAQQAAMRELEGRRGAIVAFDARDGAVLVLASSPSYNPERILHSQEEFDIFRFDPDCPELNRAIQGLYPPGSVFKIFTLATAIDLGVATPRTIFTCAGIERVARANVVCRVARGHGRIDLDRAFWDSCNIAFAKLGQMIGIENFIAYVKRFHLLDEADVALPSARGRMYDFHGFKGEVALSEAAFGQGATLLTPFQIARLTATIAQGGHVWQPYIVAEVRTRQGRVLARGHAKDLGTAISPQTAAIVKELMIHVVERGTGRGAALPHITVAGKTGTAEHPHGSPHGWFTCFAPAEQPRVVLTVLIEEGGSGSASAVPIARRLLPLLLEKTH